MAVDGMIMVAIEEWKGSRSVDNEVEYEEY